MKQNIACFICSEGLKQLLMRVILMVYWNQFIGTLYQTYKNQLKRDLVGLLFQL